MSRPNPFDGARCIVTGASMGLGRAMAVALARRGARVVMAARSADRLDDVARALEADGARPDQAIPVAVDLTVADDRRRLLDAAAQAFDGGLDLLVNNAGIGAYGRFETHDESVVRRLFELNVYAPIELCRGALPMLRRGNRPAVVNVGSIVARRGLPGRSEYSASKHALAGFTEALRAEWYRDGIHVLLVNPGFTATEFERNLAANTALVSTQNTRWMDPADVAEATLRAVARRRNELTLTARGRLLLAVNRVAPRFVDLCFGRWAARLYARADAGSPSVHESDPDEPARPSAGALWNSSSETSLP